MSMKLIYKSDIIKGVPKRWAEQYTKGASLDKQQITRQLLALPWGFTSTQVNAIIGNDSWTECKCDECRKDNDVLIRIGDDPDYEARWLDLCPDCLKLALQTIAAN